MVPNDVSGTELAALKDAGIVGMTWNVSHHGVDYFAGAERDARSPARARPRRAGAGIDDQLVPLAPMLERSGVRILFDHCGRPTVSAGLGQPGFRALLEPRRTGRTS